VTGSLVVGSPEEKIVWSSLSGLKADPLGPASAIPILQHIVLHKHFAAKFLYFLHLIKTIGSGLLIIINNKYKERPVYGVKTDQIGYVPKTPLISFFVTPLSSLPHLDNCVHDHLG
jgi:hypothetical protein